MSALHAVRIQDTIRFQQEAHLRDGQTPTKLEIGRTEDALLLAHFQSMEPHNKRLVGVTTIHGYDYNRLRVAVTKDLTGVKVS